MIIDYGETYSSDTFQVLDASNVLADAGTVTCLLTFPDGTTAVPAVTNNSTGKYSFDFTPAGAQIQAGLHQFVVTATGGILGSLVRKWSGSYDVDNDVALVSVREAISHLRATVTITSAADLEQVRWLCLAATEAIERDLGATLVRTTYTETHSGGSVIRLRHSPIISVTTVSESGTALVGTDWMLDGNAGLLWRGSASGYSRWNWTGGYNNVTVTYVAGYANPPRVARQAALTLVQSMWQSSQQAFHPALDESGAESFAAAALPGLSQMPGYDSLRVAAVA